MPRDLTTPQPKWRVVEVITRREVFARDNLEELALDALFLPMILETVYHARRSHEVTRPLFPGYLFARYCEHTTQGWEKIYGTRGVVRVLRGPLPLPAYEALRARCDDKGVIRIKRAVAELFKPGDEVRIDDPDSAYHNWIARVVSAKGGERVRLLVGIAEMPAIARADQLVKV